jgi:hypothetical protein
MLSVTTAKMRVMWLFTRHGFYSVVQDKKNNQQVQVRARIQDNLQRLSSFVRSATDIDLPTAISTPTADYAYRIVIEKALWTRIATALAAEINYTNFKDTVHGEEDRDEAYFEIWSAMNDLQEKRKRRR